MSDKTDIGFLSVERNQHLIKSAEVYVSRLCRVPAQLQMGEVEKRNACKSSTYRDLPSKSFPSARYDA